MNICDFGPWRGSGERIDRSWLRDWTHELPTIPGWYKFKDVDTLLEEGIGYVYPAVNGIVNAAILIPVSKIDGTEPYVSRCTWRIEELTNDSWEWKPL